MQPQKTIAQKTGLTSIAILWYIIVAMEAGLFFMPKNKAV